MDINPVKKYAIVINGDIEDRHFEMAAQALIRLKEDGYETYLAGSATIGIFGDISRPATLEGVHSLIQNLRSKIDANDELVIYTTGHGNIVDGEAMLCLDGGCEGTQIEPLLDAIPFGRRTVIMDQCYGGNWQKIFVDDPRTLFISAGGMNENTSCPNFSPYFWSPLVTDLNGNGHIDMEDRFIYAIGKGYNSLFAQHIKTAGYDISDNKINSAPQIIENKIPILVSFLESKNPVLVAGALRTVALSANNGLTRDEAKLFEGSIRKHWLASDSNVRFAAISAYNKMTAEPLIESTSEDIATLLGFLSDADTDVRAIAASALGNVAGKLSEKDVLFVSKKVRGMFSVAQVDSWTVASYGAFSKFLPPDERNLAIAEIANLIASSDPRMRAEALSTWAELIIQNKNPSETKQCYELLLKIALSPYENMMVRDAALARIKDIAPQIPYETANRGKAKIRSLWHVVHATLRRKAIIASSHLLFKAPQEELIKYVENFRSIMENPASGIRLSIIESFELLMPRLSKAEQQKILVAVKTFSGDKNRSVRKAAQEFLTKQTPTKTN